MKRLDIKYILFILAVSLAGYSCERDIDIDLPQAEDLIVVEATIESGSIPIVMLTKNTPYFGENSGNELVGNFVNNADVRITVDGNTSQLQELCLDQIPDSLLPLFMEITGIAVLPGAEVNFCIYTTLDLSIIGQEGKTYFLEVNAEDKYLTARTTIPNIVELDSVWFEVNPNLDSLGFAWALLSDPDTVGNAYRWAAQRINSYADGTIKDPVYVAPFNSAVDDKFFNGLSFEFSSSRGLLPYSTKPDDENEEAFFFKIGDTIAVKGMSIDRNTFLFLRSYYAELGSQGSPFATPASLQSNIEGGLGVFAGYGVYYDTIYALP